MAASLTINGRPVHASPGWSLFDCAAHAGIRVPASCQRQGRCRECIVDVSAGMDCLSDRTDREHHLEAPFRLACQCRIESAAGDVRCHTMRRGQMHIERDAPAVAADPQIEILDPAVTRDGGCVRIDEVEIDRYRGGMYGVAMDLGHAIEEFPVDATRDLHLYERDVSELAQAKRQELEVLVRKVEHCRLESHPRFFDYFVEGCLFKPIEAGDGVPG